jgi:hypothetical protein
MIPLRCHRIPQSLIPNYLIHLPIFIAIIFRLLCSRCLAAIRCFRLACRSGSTAATIFCACFLPSRFCQARNQSAHVTCSGPPGLVASLHLKPQQQNGTQISSDRWQALSIEHAYTSNRDHHVYIH